MSAPRWHVAPEALTQFATAPRALDALTASSVEAHVLECQACRRIVAAAADPGVAAASWEGVADRVDRPARTLAERVLGAFAPDHVARVVAATPALRASWLAAVLGVVASVVLVAHQTGTSSPFLALAPLIPLASVAVSFSAGADPAGETAIGTPLWGSRLLVVRTATVLVTSLGVLAAGCLALPGLEPRDAAWVLPGVALSLAALALSTWFPPVQAAGVAAAGWLASLQSSLLFGDAPDAIREAVLFDPAGQLAFAVLALFAVLTLTARRGLLSQLEAR